MFKIFKSNVIDRIKLQYMIYRVRSDICKSASKINELHINNGDKNELEKEMCVMGKNLRKLRELERLIDAD